MAIFHLEVSVIGRSKGQSAVASSAYQAGELLPEEETGTKKNFQAKAKEIQYKKILLPEYAPKEYQDRTTLWNAVQAKEKSKNARFARKINVALPNELSRVEQVALLESYVQETFVDKGMIADIAIHDKGDGNPHAHIMLTTRAFKKNGKWAPKQRSEYKLDEQGNRIPLIDPKTGKQKLGARNAKQWKKINLPYTDWDRPGKVEEWRAKWAEMANDYLILTNEKIDHRSYKRIEKETGKAMPIPTIHEGYYAQKIEKQQPGSSWKIALNRKIRAINENLKQAKARVQLDLMRLGGILDGIMAKLDHRTESRTSEAKSRQGIGTERATDRATSAGTDEVETRLSRVRTSLSEAECYEQRFANIVGGIRGRKNSLDELFEFVQNQRERLTDVISGVKQHLADYRRRESSFRRAMGIVEREREDQSREAIPQNRERTAVDQAVYGQSSTTIQPDTSNKPQNRRIEHAGAQFRRALDYLSENPKETLANAITITDAYPDVRTVLQVRYLHYTSREKGLGKGDFIDGGDTLSLVEGEKPKVTLFESVTRKYVDGIPWEELSQWDKRSAIKGYLKISKQTTKEPYEVVPLEQTNLKPELYKYFLPDRKIDFTDKAQVHAIRKGLADYMRTLEDKHNTNLDKYSEPIEFRVLLDKNLKPGNHGRYEVKDNLRLIHLNENDDPQKLVETEFRLIVKASLEQKSTTDEKIINYVLDKRYGLGKSETISDQEWAYYAENKHDIAQSKQIKNVISGMSDEVDKSVNELRMRERMMAIQPNQERGLSI